MEDRVWISVCFVDGVVSGVWRVSRVNEREREGEREEKKQLIH